MFELARSTARSVSLRMRTHSLETICFFLNHPKKYPQAALAPSNASDAGTGPNGGCIGLRNSKG